MNNQNTMGNFPFYGQEEDHECALACLKMVCSFYGKDYDDSTLRKTIPLSDKGLSLYDLVKSAGSLGFKSLLIENKHAATLDQAPLPCIMLWKSNHYIVIYSITSSEILLADPASGLSTMSRTTFLNHCKNTPGEWFVLLENLK